MLISIVTVCFNSESTIGDTLKSVESQNYESIEHIIVDGNSSDNTLDIVKKFKHVSSIISEDDNGIYDAMNKGLNLSNGEVVGFLNSDDFLFDNSVIEEYAEKFRTEQVDIIYGDLDFINNNNKILRQWRSSPFKKKEILNGWIPPHPTFYARRSLFEKLGAFDTKLKFASDYDLMIRFLNDTTSKSLYLQGCKVKLRYGGETTKNFTNIVLGNKEILFSLKKNGFKVGPFFLIKKFIYKISQFFTN